MEEIQQKVHVYCAKEQGRQSVRKREWEGERGRREIEWWRQAEETGRQATRQLQRVCQAAKSVANYAIQRGNCYTLSRMLVKTPRRQFFSRIAAAVYGNCVTQRRKANAKKPKATGRMTCENMQMQNIKSEWIELSLVYGSVWATARRRVAGVSGGLPVEQCGGEGGGRLVLPQLHFPLIKYNGPDTRRELSSTACFNYDVEIRINCQWKASTKDVGNSLLKYTL